jgi:uncharacterized protein (DUF305 family)
MSITPLSMKSLVVTTLLVLAGPALAQTGHGNMPGMNMGDMNMGGMNMGGMDPGLIESMARMNRDMPSKSAGSVDADFVMMMIPHHQAAIDMAKVELAKGSDPQQRKLAEDIIAAQEKEIAAMKAWLRAKGIQ